MKLIIPESLKKGDAIGFVSPAAGLAPFAMHRIVMAKKFFENSGYKVKTAKNSLKNNGYVSASKDQRLEDLHEMFADKEVKAIISTVGGFNSNQLLAELDYSLISKNPKIFCGYSDVTSLHFALQKKTNLATYYGPCVMTQFGENPTPLKYTQDSFFENVELPEVSKRQKKYYQSKKWTDETLDWFKKEDLKRPRRQQRSSKYFWLKEGSGAGPAWGGVIPTINGLLGTEYWVDCKSAVFFLDIPEGHDIYSGLPLAEIDFYLNHLKLAGVFRSINGLIIGRPYKFSEAQIKEFNEIILDVTKNTNYPILTLANIGHTDPIATLRYGSKIVLDSRKPYFTAY